MLEQVVIIYHTVTRGCLSVCIYEAVEVNSVES